jgi:uncharacterized membrane protein
MANGSRSAWSRVSTRLRRDLLTGMIVIVPLGATILIFKWLFFSVDGILQPAVDAIFGRPIVGIGFAAAIVLVYLAGLVGRNFIGRRVIRAGESVITEVPMVKEIYNTFKQVLESVILPQRGGFKEVVLVEFPRPGMKTLGFVTNRIKNASGEELLNVYIPTTPNPTSGYLEIMPARDAVSLNMSVEDAVKMVVSGGMVSPAVIDA